METQQTATAVPPKGFRAWSFLRRITDNPVVIKELRGRMRARTAFFLLTGYLAFIGLVVGLVYMSLAREAPYSAWDMEFRQSVGKAIFGIVVILELFLVSLIGPALTSGAITSERERMTLDVLRTTTLPARSFVLGKLGSSMAFLLLLIFTAVPIESLAFLLGGVAMEEILVSSLLLVTTAAFHCALGLFFSSCMKRTAGATVASYATVLLSYVLIAVSFFVTFMVEASTYSYSYQSQNVLRDYVLPIVLWLLVSSNPLLTAIMSEVVLVEDQSLFFTTQSMFGNGSLILPSPWIIFTLLYVLLTFVLVMMSIRFLRRPDR